VDGDARRLRRGGAGLEPQARRELHRGPQRTAVGRGPAAEPGGQGRDRRPSRRAGDAAGDGQLGVRRRLARPRRRRRDGRGGGRGSGSRTAPADPNEQLPEAYLMAIGTSATGTIGDGEAGVTDVDTLSFSVVAGQRVAFNVDSVGGSAFDSYLRVFNGSGAQL